ncbi:hypothetical protein BC829DRAFT_158753 [Chytridium lagenaria]|nr:hypothetical protein BC829DRAFT_158753 [Chytridium lagenaria]
MYGGHPISTYPRLSFFHLETFLDLLPDPIFSHHLIQTLLPLPTPNLRSASIQILKNAISPTRFSKLASTHQPRAADAVADALEYVFDVTSKLYEMEGGTSELVWVVGLGAVVNAAANFLVFLVGRVGKGEVKKLVPEVDRKFVDALSRKLDIALEELRMMEQQGTNLNNPILDEISHLYFLQATLLRLKSLIDR